MLSRDASDKERRFSFAAQSVAGCVAIGATFFLMRAPLPKPVVRAPTIVRVGFRHTPAERPVAAATQAVDVPTLAPPAPKKTVHKVVADVKKSAAPVDAASSDDDPVIIKNTGVPLEAPPVAEMAPPPAPAANVSDDIINPYAATVKPGGSTLVLGLLVDSDGTVTRTKVLIASSDPLRDLTFMMASQQQVLHDLDPPIPPGQTVWLVKAINFQTPNSVLP